MTWTVPLASLPAGDWPMIWAWNNAGPAGSDPSARLQMHSRFGKMTIPMQAIASPPSSSASSTPSAPAGDSGMGYDSAKHSRVVWAHAAMMVSATEIQLITGPCVGYRLPISRHDSALRTWHLAVSNSDKFFKSDTFQSMGCSPSDHSSASTLYCTFRRDRPCYRSSADFRERPWDRYSRCTCHS